MGAAFLADVDGAHLEFDGLGAAEGLLDVGKAFVAGVDEVFVGLDGGEIGAQGVAAIELGNFGEGGGVLLNADVPLGDVDAQMGAETEGGEAFFQLLAGGAFLGAGMLC